MKGLNRVDIMNNNTDYMVAGKELAEKVCNYYIDKVESSAIRATYADSLKMANYNLDRYQNDMSIVLVGRTREQAIAEELANISAINKKMNDELSAFKYIELECDKVLKKNVNALKKQGKLDETNLKIIIVDWACAIAGEKFRTHIGANTINAIYVGIGEKDSIKVGVQNGGVDFTDVSASNVIKSCYRVFFREMCASGAIKPVQIPEVLRNKYAKKSKKKNKKNN